MSRLLSELYSHSHTIPRKTSAPLAVIWMAVQMGRRV